MAPDALPRLLPGRYQLEVDDVPPELVSADAPAFDGRTVVFPISSAWLVLRTRDHSFGIAAPRRTTDAPEALRWVAFVRVDEDEDADDDEADAPESAAASFETIGGTIRRTETGFEGDGWSLEPHETTLVPTRAWTWIDPITWPGSALRIAHGRSREEVRAWLARHAPLPYEETSPDLFEDSDRLGHRGHLALRDGMLELYKLYGTREALAAVEGGLLREIAAGVLGPFVWDVTDEDWHVYLASGDDGPSLARYLDPASDEEQHRARRKALITPHAFEVAGAETKLALLQAIAAELALGRIADEEAFSALLRARPTAKLPRSWLVRVHGALANELDWFVRVVYGAQPRLRLSWQVV